MDPISPLVLALHNQGRPRVWSLVITIFGDAVQHRGGRIATLRMQKLLGRIGIEPGAMRTALSRLAGDGWVVRDRAGRNTYYQLSPLGKAEFQPAAQQVYAPPRRNDNHAWTLAIGDTRPTGAIRVGTNAYLLRKDSGQSLPDHLCLTGTLDSFPPKFAARAIAADHHAALLALHDDIDNLNAPGLSPLDAMAARILLIHRWRRIVLRFPEIPRQLLPESLPPCDIRARVAGAYADLLPASEQWLDQSGPDMQPMPAPDPAFHRRFQP